jgi:cellulose synthase/poly-beta-1,6-N-acetylglucosamine synthase-like glycosyltransferase
MSLLRLLGLIIGISGLFVTFFVYRGPRWKRKNFVLWGLFSLSLIIVSINPDVLNTITRTLKLEPRYRGRIFFLLISSSIILWFLFLYIKTKLDEYRYQFDLLIRRLGQEEIENFKDKILDKDIVVIIPAYNEAENLRELLGRIPERIKDKRVGVIVIDDGSTDNTRDVVIQAGHIVVSNKINRGQGGASRLGYDILVKNNIPVGVTMDADNQQMPEEIERLVEPILNNKFDLVIGSRILGQAHKTTFLRNAGIKIFTKIINLATGLKLTDCSSGFKAFKVEEIYKLNLKEEQFQAAEVIIEAAKKGLRIGEVPITTMERKYGVSKKGRDLRYGIFFAKTILKSWWR